MQEGREPKEKSTTPARLKTRKDFLRVQRTGIRSKGRFLTVMARARADSLPSGRFGLVTPKTIGKAHDRNRVKRRLRHIVSLYPNILLKRDVVIFASSHAVDANFEDLTLDLLRAESKLLSQPRPRGATKS